MAPKKVEAPERKPLIGRVGTNLKVGIVGIPNVGKSTFFNVLTKSQAAAENFPFCTIDPNENKYSALLIVSCNKNLRNRRGGGLGAAGQKLKRPLSFIYTYFILRTIILHVVLYGCETWLLTLSEESRLRVF